MKQQHNFSISDISVTFIDRTDSSDLLKTMALFGLNIEESVKFSVFGTLVVLHLVRKCRMLRSFFTLYIYIYIYVYRQKESYRINFGILVELLWNRVEGENRNLENHI